MEVARRVRTQPTSQRLLLDALLLHGDAVAEAVTALARARLLDVSNELVRLGPEATGDIHFGMLIDLYPHVVMSVLSTIALRRIRESAARMAKGSTRRGDRNE